MIKRQFKSGGVSIFVVAITAMLISILVVGFMRLMNRDTNQSSRVDISQSAYDSAQAGVEDAKRFFQKYNTHCSGGVAEHPDCIKMRAAILEEEKSCNMLHSGGYGSEKGETKIATQANRNDEKLDQAYTCVKIYQKTEDYLAEISAEKSRIIELKGDQAFNKIKISWYTDKDLVNSDDKRLNLKNILALNSGTSIQDIFPNKASYASARQNVPPVVKAKFIGINRLASGRSYVDVDEMGTAFADDGFGLNQRIYVPSSASSGVKNDSLPKTRRQGLGEEYAPKIIKCENDLSAGGYACSVEIDLGITVQSDQVALMKLTSLYTGASYKVELKNNNSIVKFDGVQPKVDSTGRANEAFRRVESRIEFSDPNFPSSDFTIYTEDKLCKKFWTTQTRSGSVKDLECN